METYNLKDMHEAGLDMTFVQDNQSMSRKGVLRGLHFQKKHPQGKLVRVIRGRVFDVAVDLRSGERDVREMVRRGVVCRKQKTVLHTAGVCPRISRPFGRSGILL